MVIKDVVVSEPIKEGLAIDNLPSKKVKVRVRV